MVQWGPDTTPGGPALRRLRLPRPPYQRIQPHPSQRCRLCPVRGLPFPADDRAAARFPGGSPAEGSPDGSSRASPTPGAGEPRSLLGPPQPGGRRRHRHRPTGDDPYRDRALRLSSLPARERADRRGRQRQSQRLRRGADRPSRPRDLRLGIERLLLRPAAPLQGLLRRRLQPSLRCLWHLDAPGAGTRLDRRQRQQATLDRPGRHGPGRRLRQLRHSPQPGRHRPRRRLLRQRRRRPRQPRRRESGGRLPACRRGAKRRWNRALGAIRVERRQPPDVDTFYTALYHALLAPRTFNDAGGATSAWTD